MHKILALVLACTLTYALSDTIYPHVPYALGIGLSLLLLIVTYKVTAHYLASLRG